MGEYPKKAAAAIALAAAVSIAGAGTALAAPSQTGLEDHLTGEITLTVDSPATDATTHDISVSFGGGTYSVTDSSGTVAGAGCTQTNPTTVSCADSRGLQSIELTGGPGADRLRILSFSSNLGFATYFGRDGDDVITAAPLPTMAGSRDGKIASNDLRGGRGDDLLTGGAGFDEIDGGKGGNDRLYGGPGGDFMAGGDGKDLVVGQSGNDILKGGRDFDRIFGGRGFDRLAKAPAGDRLRGVEKICVHLFPCNR